MKTKLTPEQSDRLIELGVDPSRASKSCIVCKEPYLGAPNRFCNDVKVPIFDLTDILALLPKNIESAWLDMYHINTNEWAVCYEQWDNLGDLGIWQDSYHTAPELIDALYKLLCWTLIRDKK